MVSVTDTNNQTSKYFVSGGFAIVESDSVAHVTAVEAIPMGDLDMVTAKKLFEDQSQLAAKASTPREKAEALIGSQVYSSMLYWAEH